MSKLPANHRKFFKSLRDLLVEHGIRISAKSDSIIFAPTDSFELSYQTDEELYAYEDGRIMDSFASLKQIKTKNIFHE